MSWNVKPRADNLDTLAVAYFRTGDVDDAIETQRKANRAAAIERP